MGVALAFAKKLGTAREDLSSKMQTQLECKRKLAPKASR
jgi:hypothetical protein